MHDDPNNGCEGDYIRKCWNLSLTCLGFSKVRAIACVAAELVTRDPDRELDYCLYQGFRLSATQADKTIAQECKRALSASVRCTKAFAKARVKKKLNGRLEVLLHVLKLTLRTVL